MVSDIPTYLSSWLMRIYFCLLFFYYLIRCQGPDQLNALIEKDGDGEAASGQDESRPQEGDTQFGSRLHEYQME